MYCGKNFEKKEDLEKAIKNGEKVTTFMPHWMKKRLKVKTPTNGIVAVMGPHIHFKTGKEDNIPECKEHKWVTDVRIENGVIKEVF